MIEKETTTLQPSDIVVIDGYAYRADIMLPKLGCEYQCHLYDTEAGKCSGYCYRWDNAEGIVFRRLMPVTLLSDKTIVCVTPDLLRKKLVQLRVEQKLASEVKQEEKKRKGWGE